MTKKGLIDQQVDSPEEQMSPSLNQVLLAQEELDRQKGEQRAAAIAQAQKLVRTFGLTYFDIFKSTRGSFAPSPSAICKKIFEENQNITTQEFAEIARGFGVCDSTARNQHWRLRKAAKNHSLGSQLGSQAKSQLSSQNIRGNNE